MLIKLFDVPIDAGTFSETVATIRGWINARSLHHQVVVANVHLLTEARENARIMNVFEASSLAVTDGMPLVWLARKHDSNAERIVGVDLMHALCKGGGKIFLLGGAEGVAETLGKKLYMQYPGLIIAGTACPPFRKWTEEEDAALIARINAAAPDMVFVAFGAPKQELWIHKHKHELNVPVLIGVGAAFDYAVGRLKRAPRLMQLLGLEWFFRLLQEPRRLYKRYATSNLKFLKLVLGRPSTPPQSEA